MKKLVLRTSTLCCFESPFFCKLHMPVFSGGLYASFRILSNIQEYPFASILENFMLETSTPMAHLGTSPFIVGSAVFVVSPQHESN